MPKWIRSVIGLSFRQSNLNRHLPLEKSRGHAIEPYLQMRKFPLLRYRNLISRTKFVKQAYDKKEPRHKFGSKPRRSTVLVPGTSQCTVFHFLSQQGKFGCKSYNHEKGHKSSLYLLQTPRKQWLLSLLTEPT